MVTQYYIPDQLDIILIDLDPQPGSEMSKRRPCLVLSKRALNSIHKRALICPITSAPPQGILQIPIPTNQKNIQGTIMLDQLKSLDYRVRNAKKIDELIDLELYDHISSLIGVIIHR
ncbi:MAG: type II toxin-antitoxin system PemK/MazF family toxin [Saprospiraceae bacterium]|nr:type II toxin-antitoxin system PemK/MazF family toxin [Saprospiraceae bacterium]